MSTQNGNDDLDTMEAAEQEAFCLSEAAIKMDQSRADTSKLARALEHNMELWVAIRMLISRDDSGFSEETKANLRRLCQFVAETTMSKGTDLSPETLDTLINIILQISEGLLEGNKT